MTGTSRQNALRLTGRRVPPLGGFNLTFLGLEIKRLLRNRRTVLVSIVLPVIFYFIFRQPRRGGGEGIANLDAYVMISVAVYAALTASTAGGAMVSIERASGWSRQLRLTPLRPAAYIAIKVLTAMVLGLLSVAAVFAVGAFSGTRMAPDVWILSGLVAWAGAFVFAAFGLFMGYLLPSENIMQILGPILAFLAFFGGLLVPLTVFGPTFQAIATYTPAYGIGAIARSPLLGSGLTWGAVLNVVGWTAAFVVGATILFRRDTRRV